MPPKKKTKVKAAKTVTTAQRLAALVKSCRDSMRKDKGLNGDLDRLPQLTWVLFLKFLDDLESVDEERAALSKKAYLPLIPPPYRWRDWAATATGITGDELIAFVNNDEAVLPVSGPDGKPQRGPGLFKKLRTLEARGEGGDRREVIARAFSGTSNRMLNGYLLREVINKIQGDERTPGIHFTASEELHTLGRLYEGMLREMRDAAGDAGEFYTPRPLIQLLVRVIDPRLGEVVLDPACGTGGFLVEAYEHLFRQVQASKRNEDRVAIQGALRGQEAKSLPYLLAEMNLLLHGIEVPQIAYGNSLSVKLTELGDRDRVDVILTNPPFGGEEEASVKKGFPGDLQTSETALLFLQLIARRLKRKDRTGRGGRAAVIVPNGTLYELGAAERIRKHLIEEAGLHTVLRLPKGVFEPYTDIATNVLFFEQGLSVDQIWFYEHPLPPHRARLKGKCYSATDGLRFEECEPFIEWWADKHDNEQAWSVPVETLAKSHYDLALTHPRAQAGVTEGTSALLGRIRTQSRALEKGLDALERTAKSLQSVRGELVPLSELLTERDETVSVVPGTSYRRIRVQLHFRGALLRDEVDGADIGTKVQTVVQEGDLILSRIDARNGAMALIPPELSGAIATGDFPVFEIDVSRVDPEYLRFALFQPHMIAIYERLSRGSTNRRRLKVGGFQNLRIPVPEPDDQAHVVSVLNSCEVALRDLKARLSDAGDDLDGVLGSLMVAAFGEPEPSPASAAEDEDEGQEAAG